MDHHRGTVIEGTRLSRTLNNHIKHMSLDSINRFWPNKIIFQRLRETQWNGICICDLDKKIIAGSYNPNQKQMHFYAVSFSPNRLMECNLIWPLWHSKMQAHLVPFHSSLIILIFCDNTQPKDKWYYFHKNYHMDRNNAF